VVDMKLTTIVAVLACAACTAPTPAPPVEVSPPVAATPTTSSPPTARISPAALLTPVDFGAGYSLAEPSAVQSPPTEPAYLLPVMECAALPPGAPDYSGALVSAGLLQLYAAPRGHYDSLTVWRYRGTGAADAIREVRDQLRLCPRNESVAEENTRVTRTWTVLATDFAGAGSLAIRNELARNAVVSDVDFHVIVRRGDAVASLWLSDQRWTAARLRAIGQRIAARLADA